jgi:replicative DNA helicase
MNNESKLLSKVLHDRDVAPLFDRGVQDTWFVDPTNKRIWEFTRQHFFNYAEVPSLDVIKENFPNYVPAAVSDSVEYLIDAVVATRRKANTIGMVQSAISALEKEQNHEQAILNIQSGLIKLEEDGLSKTNDLDLTSEATKRFDEYEWRKNNPGLLGVPTGFPTIDIATGGLQNGQLIVIVAPPKTGKSTLALQIAQNVHMTDKKVMFQSFEMSNHEQLTRYDAQKARVSHNRLINGKLTPEEETRYKRVLQGIEGMRERFWLVDSAAGSTVTGITSKIQVLHPDVVFIDGTYLMIDEQSGEANTPQAITNITRSLKRMAQKFKVPVVISTQALNWKMKKGQLTADSIGYSSSFHQDADVIFGLQRIDDAIDDMRMLKILDSRNSGRSEVALNWDWNTGQFREMEGDDWQV